jgi:hypothetical protein
MAIHNMAGIELLKFKNYAHLLEKSMCLGAYSISAASQIPSSSHYEAFMSLIDLFATVTI